MKLVPSKDGRYFKSIMAIAVCKIRRIADYLAVDFLAEQIRCYFNPK